MKRRGEQLAGRAGELADGGYVKLSAETVEDLDLQSEALIDVVRRAGCQTPCLYEDRSWRL